MKDKLLVICGPTATQKTALALKLAKEFNGELVSADSRQVYRGMDIGTGKDIDYENRLSNVDYRDLEYKNKKYRVAPYDFEGVNVWMYDVVNPDEEFSVSHYECLATKVIADILSRGKLPILVGGTGLYIKAIVTGIPTNSIPRNDALRNELQSLSRSELQQRLQKIDSSEWSQLNNSDKNNPRRLIRKIEIAASNQSEKKNPKTTSYDVLSVGLTAAKETLKQKITDRVNKREEQGIVKEIESLLKRGYSFDLPAFNTLGYKEWKEYLQEPTESNKAQALREWTHGEVLYAKRQMTWFKKQPDIHWYAVDSNDTLMSVRKLVSKWYT